MCVLDLGLELDSPVVNFPLVGIEIWFLHIYQSVKRKIISQKESTFPVFVSLIKYAFK